jgi:hypothetical protein
MDMAVCEVAAKIRNAPRQAAIESAGLTAQDTAHIPLVRDKHGKFKDVEENDLDVVETAIEGAVQIASSYVSWMVVEDLLNKRNYLNPFVPLMGIFKLGAWPLGALSKEYIVLVPSGKKGDGGS